MTAITGKKIASDTAAKIIDLLNQNLANTLDLKLQAKQAHWNVRGPSFIALHELFDKIAAEVDEYADMQAERIAQLGGIAKGTLQAIAVSSLKAYPIHLQNSQDHIEALVAALSDVADSSRQLIDMADDLDDKVTADMCTEIARGLDKLRWFVEAHTD